MQVEFDEITITITYEGEIDPGLDKSISEAMEGIGFEWYGYGFNKRTKVRDLRFIQVSSREIE